MAVPYGKHFAVQFDEVFPEGAYVVGEVTAVTKYQSQAKWITWVIRVTVMRAVYERTGKHAETKPGPAASADVRSAAA